MKIKPAFFRAEPIQRLLNRAVKISALPVSLHYITHDGNELYIMGWGGCEACKRVNHAPAGSHACRASRARATALALQQDTPVTFVCHLGFTCVAAAVLPGNNYVLTFGPYVPAEANQSIAYDVARGLRAIDETVEDTGSLPFVLDDVRVVPSGSVSATAEWLIETLREAVEDYAASEQEQLSETTDATDPTNNNLDDEKKVLPDMSETDAWMSLTVLALVCGRFPIVRDMLADKLDELHLSQRASAQTLQAFLMQTVSVLLESGRQMGGLTVDALNNYPQFVTDVRALSEPKSMLKAAMRVLRRVQTNERKPVPSYLPEVVDIVHKQYRNDLNLTELADRFGVAPSTITRALECRIHGSFTEYLGRVRVEHARRLLRDTRLTATQIGPRVGIDDQSNFGKLFRRFAGVTPGEYRQRFQK